MIDKIKYVLLSLIVGISLTISTDTEIVKAETNSNISENLTHSEYVKLAEALNMTKTNSPVDMGNSYKVFDTSSDNFKNSFLISAYTIPVAGDSVTGKSSYEISKAYANKFGKGTAINIGAAAYAGFNLGNNFDKSISSSLSSINEEYYDYWEVKKTMKIAQIDWKNTDATSFFSSDFKNTLKGVNDIESAKQLLNKYGTHVFDNYYFGGKLIISRYICSSENIKSSDNSNSINFELKSNIVSAISANANNESYQMSATEINNETTKTSTKVIAKGGNELKGITPDDIFTYKQEYANGYESGFVYAAWLDSIGKCESLRIVDADKPIAIWDVIKTSSLYDANTYDLLIQAYEIISCENYSKDCIEYNIAPGYISSICVETPDYTSEFDLSSREVSAPINSSLTFEYSEALLETFKEEELELKITSGNNYCSLIDKKLAINSNANDKKIFLSLQARGYEIFQLYITVRLGDFKIGYGTETQPYFINDLSEWNQFINNSKYYSSHFKLTNDIDLKGKVYQTGGSSNLTSFKGMLDGDFHKIYNGTIISNSSWNQTGIIGINKGEIKNLIIDNIKVLNHEKINSKNNGNINVGVLVGKNEGKISKVSISNSSIRVTAHLDDTSYLNIGTSIGLNYGTCELVSVENSNICGISYDGSGMVCVGGLVGKVDSGNITNCSISNSSINSYNFYNKFGNVGDYYCNLTNSMLYQKAESGVWEEIGVLATEEPEGKIKYDFYYNLNTNKLYRYQTTEDSKRKKVWVEQTIDTKVKSGTKLPKDDIAETAIYSIGGFAGYTSAKCNITFIVLYKNIFNQNNKKFGNVSGSSVSDSNYENVFFESVSNKAINNNTYDGCTNLRKLTLENISNAEWNKTWIDGENGYPVLKWEEDQNEKNN